jgi:hypothetical protein
VLYELPYLWKSVDNEMVSPGVLVRASPTHLQLFSPETAGDSAQGISPGTKKMVDVRQASSLSQHDEKHVVPTPLSIIVFIE